MADVNQFISFILKWEGGFADTPGDAGGATNMGVTLGTWRQVGYDKNGDGLIDVEDLKRLTADEVVERVLKPHYWKRWCADEIHDRSLAHLLVDWVWSSGAPGITVPQQVLGVKADGIVGPKTLAALNGHSDPRGLFDRIKAERFLYLGKIVVARPANLKFLIGWINRLNDLNYTTAGSGGLGILNLKK